MKRGSASSHPLAIACDTGRGTKNAGEKDRSGEPGSGRPGSCASSVHADARMGSYKSERPKQMRFIGVIQLYWEPRFLQIAGSESPTKGPLGGGCLIVGF